MAELALDLVLAAALLSAALGAIYGTDPRTSIVSFIVFGLLASLAWARVGAPDVALAEAALGAGITGGLLLDSLARRPQMAAPPSETPVALQVASGLAVAVLGVILAAAVLDLPAVATGISREASAALPQSGVAHPVTAVLLNFRAYDTWLEVAVVLAAGVGAAVVGGAFEPGRAPARTAAGPVLTGFARWMVPILVLVGGYLLWRGTTGPGGAFQGGAVLAAAAVLAHVAGLAAIGGLRGVALRLTLCGGTLAFAVVGGLTLLRGDALIELPVEVAGTVIVAVELAVTLAVAVTLAAIFATAGAGDRGAP